MALLHVAEIRPTKLELLNPWLPTRTWYRGPAAPDLKRVAAYRFDDPDGEVGVETMIVQSAGGPLLQVPLTYRAAPLEGHDQWLIGTMEHSVLGPRWAYDGCGDPVYARTLAHTIFTGSAQADEFIEIDGELKRREAKVAVRGSGTAGADVPAIDALGPIEDADPTLIHSAGLVLVVARVLEEGRPSPTGAGTLTGSWDGQPTPLWLAHAELV